MNASARKDTGDAAIAGLTHSDLWFEFWRNSDSSPALGNLIEAMLPLVHTVLERVSIRLPSHVPVDDLLQTAVLGLYHAITRFDPTQGVSFEAFACPRIRGAILDELRNADHVSRSTRAALKEIEAAIRKWTQTHGACPTEDELAKEMDMARSDLTSLMDRAQPLLSLDDTTIQRDGKLLSLKDILADTATPGPEQQVEQQDMLEHMRKAFLKLSDREQRILYLYYFEDLKVSEIAQLYEVTSARICQIHALAVSKLRAILSSE